MREEIVAEIKNLSMEEKDLRQFAFTMTFILGILAILALRNSHWVFPFLMIAYLGFGLFGLIRPNALKKVYLKWMTLAYTLGFYMTTIILGVLFYVLFTIIGKIARIFDKNMLDQEYDSKAVSYWQKKEKPSNIRQHFERQF